MISVNCFSFGPISSNTYLCRDAASGETLVIDPGLYGEKAVSSLAAAKPTMILLTHGHFDHISAAVALKEACGARIFVSEGDAPKLQDPSLNASTHFVGRTPVSFRTDETFGDNAQFSLGESVFRVLATPGHTSGSVCFLCENLLFSGDTLFWEGFGRCDLPTGNQSELARSLERLLALSDSTRVLPGHGEETTIGAERKEMEQFVKITAKM